MRSDVEEARIDGRLAARELHDAAGHRTLVAQRLQHLADGLEIRLVDVAGGVGVGETDRAGQVAAVGEVDVGQPRVAGVQVAEAAIVGAAGGVGDDGIFQAAVVAEGPLLHLQVQPRVGIDDVAEVAVVRAVLLHDDLAGVFEDPWRQSVADNPGRATGCVLGRPFWQRLDGRTRIGSFGLYYLKLRHDPPF